MSSLRAAADHLSYRVTALELQIVVLTMTSTDVKFMKIDQDND